MPYKDKDKQRKDDTTTGGPTMHDINKITVYAPSDPPELHDAIVAMMERKSGKPVYIGHARRNRWLFIDQLDGTVVVGSDRACHLQEITLHDLESIPDHVDTKEMTVAEISKELGYDVKIIK